MRRVSTHNLGILLLSMAAIFSDVVVAEVYKWVDADGDVHFGDKPHESMQARDAQPVNLRESYQPPARTAQEQQVYDDEQRKIMLRDQMRRRNEAQAQEEDGIKRAKEKAELCTTYEEAINGLSTVVVENGVRTVVYLAGEDGKSISSERQREIIEEFQAKKADAGCT